MKTVKIGDVILLNGVKLKCVDNKDQHRSCRKCYANNFKYHDFCDKLNCRDCDRTDSKDVRFEEVQK
jgi:hypothetical protein